MTERKDGVLVRRMERNKGCEVVRRIERKEGDAVRRSERQ